MTQPWPLSPTFIPGFRELFLPKKSPILALHVYQTILGSTRLGNLSPEARI